MQLLTYFDSPSTFNELILNIDDDQCLRFEAVKWTYFKIKFLQLFSPKIRLFNRDPRVLPVLLAVEIKNTEKFSCQKS